MNEVNIRGRSAGPSPMVGRLYGYRERQEVEAAGQDFVFDFLPAIRETGPITASERCPKWYAVRYIWSSETLLFRIFKKVGYDYHVFSYQQKQTRLPGEQRRADPVTRSWFPGYVFLHLDIRSDRWQQIYQMPGFLQFLGSPTAIADDEIEKLGRNLAKKIGARDPKAKFNPGDDVMIIDGPFTSFPATVASIDWRKKLATVVAMIFGRPSHTTLSLNAIEKI